MKSKAWCGLREHCVRRRRLAVIRMKGDNDIYIPKGCYRTTHISRGSISKSFPRGRVESAGSVLNLDY